MSKRNIPPLTYADAGVSIDKGDAFIAKIKPFAKATARLGTDSALGGFGGTFDLKAIGYEDPILVSSTDGVGTKLRIAIDTGILNTVGIDLVAMCVNDILAQGAEPLFFLDYFATGNLSNDKAATVIKSIADGCLLSGCALIGGETAEMPDMYAGNDFDLAGFVVGAVERSQMLPRCDDMKSGDILIGLNSSGPHSNGYSLIRRVVELSKLAWTDKAPFAPEISLGETLLTPTRIYVKSVLTLIKSGKVKGLAHITGGGLNKNTPRMLPDMLTPEYDLSDFERPAVFNWLQEVGQIEESEMMRTFNCGIGLVLCVAPDHVAEVLVALTDAGEEASVIGQLRAK